MKSPPIYSRLNGADEGSVSGERGCACYTGGNMGPEWIVSYSRFLVQPLHFTSRERKKVHPVKNICSSKHSS